MLLSKDPADKRLVNLFKLRRSETRRTAEAVEAEELAEESKQLVDADSFDKSNSQSSWL